MPVTAVTEKAHAKSSAKTSVNTSVKVNNVRKTAERKEKLVRDSFTMPHDDYALISSLKNRAVIFKRPAKKSELLRAGLHALQAMPAAALRAALDALSPLKSGRPKKSVI